MTKYDIEDLIEKLNEAYGTSTPSNNRFEKAIKAIKWETTFEADGETYYVVDDLTLTVENLDPFKEAWKPSIIVGTCYKELGWI